MTRDEIIRMAMEAGLCIDGEVAFSPNHNGADVDIADLQTFAALVAAAEREALLSDGVADKAGREWWATTRHTNGPRTLSNYANDEVMREVFNTAKIVIAAAIRARREQ